MESFTKFSDVPCRCRLPVAPATRKGLSPISAVALPPPMQVLDIYPLHCNPAV